uniref:Aminopeptidase n=1 Tax=Elaeophora elaphi TaxID=1147741 RepID=A0A0R3RW20_9BILA
MYKFFSGLGSVKSWKSSKLENVDLNDQHGLITMAEANNKVADSNPAIPIEKKGPMKKENVSKNVTCTMKTAYFLFLIAVASIVLSSFITYWVTRETYDRSLEIRPFVDAQQAAANVSVDESPIEEEPSGPTAAELRIPKDIMPRWYNLTIKIFLPGYVDIPTNKNMTFDAALTIKFWVAEETDKIVLNSLKLNFSENMEKIKILQDKVIQTEQARTTEIEEMESTMGMAENETESSTFTPEMTLEDMEVEDTTVEHQPASSSTKVAADVQVKEIVVNETLEMVTLLLDGKLEKDQEYYLQIAYSGPIHMKLAGLYLSRYQNDQDMTRYVAVTQMEPTDARRMVPCFDEPEFKAVWKIKAIHPAGTSAVSNGIEIKNAEKTDDSDWVATTFIESPPMSSYLLALAITDFDYIEGTTSMGTRLRICKSILNMMALPDFAAGAMENWGLITYREKYLLYDERLYAPSQKVSVALVVAHELAHQWFGNLVTMKWWNDLWLNEGFATFMEYLGADAISKGSFRMGDYFLQDAVKQAYRRDGQATSHPLSFPIDKAEDVSEAFDAITYDKGSAIIFMIQHVMGSDNFRKGLHDYLDSHKYHNADHDDLWSALNGAVPDTLLSWEGDKLDIRDFASKWTQQMGYPVVEVRRIDEKKIELRQKRFKWDENALEREKFRNARFWYKYDIPIWYAVNGEEMPMTWLHESQGLDLSEEDLLVLNSGSKGFYRVNYNPELWLKITDQLQKDPTKIDVRTRARILDDAFALAEANYISYEIPLNLMQYLPMEEEFLPWRMALNGIGIILENFNDEPETQHIRDYLEPLILPLYNRIDWEILQTSYLDDELFFQNELHYAIIQLMYHLRNINCTEKLHSLFLKEFLDRCQDENALSSECSIVPIPVRSQVYCEGVRIGAEKIWNQVFQLYRRERVQVERDRLLGALTCSRDSFTLKKLLKLASDLNDTSIRLQDTPSTFGYVGAGDVGRLIIFDYFQDSWVQLHSDMKEQQNFLRKIILSSTSISNERKIAQLEAFIKKYRKDTSKLDVFGQQLEKSRTAKLWRDRNLNVLTEWFRKQNMKSA